MQNKNCLLLIIILINLQFISANLPCNKRNYGESSFVCVCSSESCDEIDPLVPEPKGNYLLYTSDRDNNRFALQKGEFKNGLQENFVNGKPNLKIKRNETQQEIFGFGGAFTDATGINVNSLNLALQDKLLESYFGTKGIEYNFGRVPIGGTDFSTHGYSYDDLNCNDEDINPCADKDLENFKLQDEDFKLKIPLIQKAKVINPDLKLFASAWTAPKWMKTNNKFTGGEMKPEYYQTWADYYIQFFEAYEKQNITFWGVTSGNEPSLALAGISSINTVGWLPSNMHNWILNNFGPTIKNSKYSNLKFLVLDDQRFFLPWYPKIVITNETSQFIDGIAVHWYWDFIIPAVVLDKTHNDNPDKFLLATEACSGSKFWEKAVLLGDWSRAESYAHSIIEDITHYVTGWVDWNLVLDLIGGPTYINNFVDALIIVNQTAQEFYKQPMYYAMGHFSKFIPRGSYKIQYDGIVTNKNVEIIAFERPDNAIVVVLHNRQDNIETVVINDSERGHVELNLNAKSINTFIYY